jgi:hypothetical protein
MSFEDVVFTKATFYTYKFGVSKSDVYGFIDNNMIVPMLIVHTPEEENMYPSTITYLPSGIDKLHSKLLVFFDFYPHGMLNLQALSLLFGIDISTDLFSKIYPDFSIHKMESLRATINNMNLPATASFVLDELSFSHYGFGFKDAVNSIFKMISILRNIDVSKIIIDVTSNTNVIDSDITRCIDSSYLMCNLKSELNKRDIVYIDRMTSYIGNVKNIDWLQSGEIRFEGEWKSIVINPILDTVFHKHWSDLNMYSKIYS